MSDALEQQKKLPNLLIRNRNFLLLWAAYGISAIGDHLSEQGLLKASGALESGSDKSTRIQALLSLGFFLPYMVFGPIAGWWADRFSRKTTMIITDIIRAGIVISFIWSVPFLQNALRPYGYEDFAVMLPLMCVGIIAAFFSPSRLALMPTLIKPNQLVRANAMINAMGTIGTIISFMIGGVIVHRLGRNAVYCFDTLTFIVSATLLSMIALRCTRPVPAAVSSGVWTPLKDGFRYVRTHSRTFQMILLGACFWAGAGIVTAVIPAIIKQVVAGWTIEDIGIFRGTVGIGLATGAALMTLFGPSIPTPVAVIAGLGSAFLWLGALCITYMYPPAFIAARFPVGVCLFGVGVSGTIILVTVITTLQRIVPDSRRGRVFGVMDMATMGAMVATSAALGLPNIPNIDQYVPTILAVTAIGFAIATFIAWRIYRKQSGSTPALSVVWNLAEFYGKFWCRLIRVGPCTVPREGPVILAMNHTSGVDPIAVYASCSHRVVSFMVAAKYYRIPIAKQFMKLVNCVPIDRENPKASSLGAALRLLHDDGCLGIFPEGTYPAPSEPLPEPKPGVGLLALRTGATVIPCHISGASHTLNPFWGYFKRHRITVRYGKPVDLSRFAGREKDKDAPAEATELIMQQIFELAP